MTFVHCPDCDLPAEVADRFALPSTDGPVEHIKTRCLGGHWFTLPAEHVKAIELGAPAEPVAEPGRAGGPTS